MRICGKITVQSVKDGVEVVSHWTEEKGFSPEPGLIHCLLAEGDALRHILENFANLPRPTVGAFRCRWYGDHAKFIAGNLDCKLP